MSVKLKFPPEILVGVSDDDISLNKINPGTMEVLTGMDDLWIDEGDYVAVYSLVRVKRVKLQFVMTEVD